MRDLNLWIGTGRLGKDPMTRQTQGGDSVCSVSLACAFDDKTEWVNVVFWKKQGELVQEYCKKGSFIRVSGRMQTREWTDKQGEKKYTTEIIASEVQFLGGKGEQEPKKQPKEYDYDKDPESRIPF